MRRLWTLPLLLLGMAWPSAADIDIHAAVQEPLNLEYKIGKSPAKILHMFLGRALFEGTLSLPTETRVVQAVAKNPQGDVVWSGPIKNFVSALFYTGADGKVELANGGWYVITGQGYPAFVKIFNLTGAPVKVDFTNEDGSPGPHDVALDATPANPSQVDLPETSSGTFKMVVKDQAGQNPQPSHSLVAAGHYYTLTNSTGPFVFTELGLVKSPGAAYEK